MATDTSTSQAVPSYKAGRARPGGGAEFWSWIFMRVSAIVLLFLAVGHVLIMHIPAGGVSRVDFGFVAGRWAGDAGVFWRTWDWLLLTLALIHGINGMRVVTLDYVRRPGIRVTLDFIYFIVGIVLFILGTIVVVTFDPTRWLAGG